MIDPIVLLALLLLFVLSFILFHVGKSLGDIFLLIQRLANRDFRTLILMPPFGLFQNTVRNLRKITETLQTFSSQISDETFNLQAILSSMAEGILLVDSSQRIYLCNNALLNLFDFSSPPIGKTIAEAFQIVELQKAIRETLSSHSPTTTSFYFTKRNGQTFYLDVRCNPLRLPEFHASLRGVIVVFHDITQIKRTEDLRKDFVANVTH
ncbi:MAG: PAS domain-containing protein, partial [Chthoniobacterales bacterium]|nr:PAS domain-containing protein [Chthoniobacterales bacterium]